MAGGWLSISEVARLYGKSWKWAQNQVKRHNISTEKRDRQRVLRVVDFIAHLGEPPSSGITESHGSHSEEAEIITPEAQIETALLKQENQFLRWRIEELKADREDWKAERSKLQSIIERQTMALPPAEKAPGVFSRLLGGLR